MADEAARELVRTALERTLFVEAGAGTGKTTALVGRIVELVRNGAAMRRIAAITFTEAAAGELRERVRVQLEEAAHGHEDLRAAVDEVDEAALTTLHSFAQRILTEHPLEAGLPPAFEVLDETRSALAFDDTWDGFVEALLSDDALEPVVLRALTCDLRWASLREVARHFAEHWDRLESLEVTLAPLSPVDASAVVEAAQVLATLAPLCTHESDALGRWARAVASWAGRLRDATSELETLQLLAQPPWKTSEPPKGAAARWQCDLGEVRAARDAVLAAHAAALEPLRREVLAYLLDALRRLTLGAARSRAAEGHLQFHDLLVLARNVVRDHPAVRAALAERYSHLLVDEFQDTDPVQVELVTQLAGGDPGRLFFVGDAMQSIYRFRGADIRTFSQVRVAVGGALSLTDNWRSVPAILTYVNAFFEATVGAGVEGALPPYTPLVPSRPPLAGAHPVVLLGGPAEQRVGAVRETEAGEVAAVVRRIVKEAWPTRSGRVALRDIAILLPTRATLAQLEVALEQADVPYRIESASLVWASQEVRDLLNVLRVVDDPTDEVSLVGALRAPSFGCGDDDLLEFRRAGGRWDIRQPPPAVLAADHPVVAALAELRSLHEERWWTGVSGLVERVLRELRFFPLAFAHRRPRDRWRRLRWVLDQARAFEEDGAGTLRDFVAWATRQADEDVRVKDSPLPEADDDAVRVLTIHAAKGLQFPVVVLAGLNRQAGRSGNPPATVLWDDGGQPHVSAWGGFETEGYPPVAAREKLLDQHEQLRLLYVGMTRAEDHLVVSVHHPARKDSQARQLWKFSAEHEDLWRRLPPEELTLEFPPSQPAPAGDPGAPARRQTWAALRSEALQQLRRAPVRAATAIADRGAPADHASGDGSDGAGLPWRRGRAGTAIGRAVHATLQVVDLASGAGAAELARAQAAAEGVEDAAGEVERLVRAALRSATVRAAVRHRHWREVYVAAPVGGVTVEGFVDLLYETPDGLVVVDYKTDVLRSAAAVEVALARYRLQAAAYALVLQESLGRRVQACRFLFLSTTGVTERDVDDLAAAVEEVRRTVV